MSDSIAAPPEFQGELIRHVLEQARTDKTLLASLRSSPGTAFTAAGLALKADDLSAFDTYCASLGFSDHLNEIESGDPSFSESGMEEYLACQLGFFPLGMEVMRATAPGTAPLTVDSPLVKAVSRGVPGDVEGDPCDNALSLIGDGYKSIGDLCYMLCDNLDPAN